MSHSSTTLCVAHLVNRLDHGVAAGDLTRALNTHTQFDSTVISLQKPPGFPDDVPVIYPTDGNVYSKISISRIRWLRQKISEFDVVTAHHTFAGLFGAIIGTLTGVDIVAREGNNHREFSNKVRGARTMTGLLADRIVCVSESVADSYRGFERLVPRTKIRVITNGVDIEAVQAARQNSWSIYSTADVDPAAAVAGTAGMLIEQKNHETLIRAIARMQGYDNLNVELVIAGSGPRKEFLEALTGELGVQDRVHFLGYLERDSVYKMLHEIDCYAMPSRWEGFSAAVLQAMAAGTPCVLSDIPSFQSQYPDTVARFHSPESVGELGESIAAILTQDPDKGQRGFEFVAENHSIKRMARRYEALYNDIIDE